MNLKRCAGSGAMKLFSEMAFSLSDLCRTVDCAFHQKSTARLTLDESANALSGPKWYEFAT